MGDDSEWQKLPAEEKCQHKVWKARVSGYEEMTKMFQRFDEKSSEFSKYAGLMKKFVTDSNAISQEKGLDAVLAFVENAPTNVCGRSCNDVVNGVVTKCLNASKQKTKEKGMEIVMLYIEAEKPDIVQECLMTGLENKQPKIVIGCIQTITLALRDFGTKVIQVKPLLKHLARLLDDRDKNVREETKQLVIELYRWIGAALKPQMTNFKPIQVQEFEAEFEKLPSTKAQQTRFMRSQQQLKAKMEEQQAAAATTEDGEAGGEVVEEEAIDPYDLMTPVDIIGQLPKPFFEQIEAKKWQERKEMLEAVQKLSDNPRLEGGDYGGLMRALLKVVAKDTNVMLVVIAAKTITGIANGLRKKFQPYGSQCVSTILEKFKEKKVTVVQALREAIDAAFQSITLEAIMEDVLASLENKNPSIKTETALFMARCFARLTQSSLPKKMLKAYVGPLLKTANEATPELREASFEALGTAMKVVSEKNIAPFLVDVDSLKMQKIQEWNGKCVLLNAKGEPRGGGGGAAPATAAAAKPAASAAPASKPAASAAKPKAGSDAPKVVKRPGKPAASGGPAKKAGGKAKKAPVEEKLENLLSDEAVEEKAQAFFPGDTLTTLVSANWKERLAAMETVIKVVSSTSRDDIPCQVCVRTLIKKPGLKDTNFQVLKQKLDALAQLARNSKFSKRSAEFCIPDVVDKIGDVKNGAAAKDAFTAMSEAVGLEYISIEVIARAFEQKSPKNQQESLVWMSTAITEFGLKIKVKDTIPVINKALAASNPGVRGAAITLLGVIYMYMGDTLRVFFENEKPTLLQQIDAEFAKVKDTKPPAPTRKLLSATGGPGDDDDNDDDDAKDDEQGGGDVAVEDLVPRNDISEKITDGLVAEMGDKNWKVRAEALQKVTSILSEAKFVTAGLGSLPEALKARLGDANKNLQMTTIAICQTLATALGPHTKGHYKVIGPGLISCMSDSKPVLREKVVTCMNVWAESATLLPLVECEAIYDGLKMENPTLRAELLGWLSDRLPSHKQLPVEFRGCIPLVLACLEDRNPDVRKKAGDALVPFMIHTGYDTFLKALGKCKPTSKDQIQPLLEKARGNLPAKPTKAKKAAAPAESSAPAPVKPKAKLAATTAPAVEDDEEPEKPAEKPPAKAEPKKVVKGRGKAPAPSSKKKEEEDFGPVMSINVTKEQRIKEEKAMKVLKWNFLELRGEYKEQLQNQMEKNFNKAIMADLWQTDFKFHIKAIEQLIKCLETQEKETVSNVDLILKWFTIRFFDTNPSMLNKALDYLQRLFNLLSSLDYHLNDLEASSFVPYLILKSGDPKDNVRRDVRNILKMLCKVYPSSKMFSFVIDGLKSKVSKQRTELLEELGGLIETFGINVCQPSPAHALKNIAGFIGERDNGVRNAALNTIVVAYHILGETVYKYVGNLKEKDQSYLDERIKRSTKESKPAKEPLQTQPQPQQIQRPKTAPAKSVSSPRSQSPASPAVTGTIKLSRQQQQSYQNHHQPQSTVKRTYQLDIEPEENFEPVCPNLIQLDLDGLMAPVVRPVTAVRPTYSDQASSLAGLSDVSTGIDKVVTLIGSGNIDICIKGLIQIDELMKGEKVEVLSGHVDHILLATTKQFKMGVSDYLLNPAISNQDVVQLFRCLLSTLLSIFDKSGLGRKASSGMLKDLVQALITIILDQQVERLEGGPQIIRIVNMSVVKIINKSDPTNITCAIISLIKECLQSETCSSNFLELVTKCLWKVLNLVPETVNDLNLDRVLCECHRFFQAFPPSSWKSRPSLDMPIRTIKTLLHNLTKLKGQKILKHTKLIETSDKSEVEVYLQSVLARSNFKSEDGPEKQKSSSNRRMSKTHEVLSEIFTKIGTKENTREGLNDLFDFKKKYPEADVEPFLKKTSPHFQKYINNMLAEIDEERKKSKNNEFQTFKTAKTTTTTGSRSSDEEEPDADYYREKLRELRARCGLDSNNADTDRSSGSKSSALSTDDNDSLETPLSARKANIGNTDDEEDTSPPSQPEPVRQSVDVTSLKARLERIKKMANS